MKKLIVASLTSILIFASMTPIATARERVTKHRYSVNERIRNARALAPSYVPADDGVTRYDAALGAGLVGH